MSDEFTKMPKSIALIGLMGVGKTSIGKRLAPLVNMPFFDADVEIEAAAEMKVADIFEAYGEQEFRRLEQRVIERLLSDQACVLATGGGAYVQPTTKASIDTHATTVWLDAEITTLVERTRGRQHRPLLNGGDHAEILSRLKDQRDPHYAQADIHIHSHGNSDEQGTVLDLLPLLKAHNSK